ncbi:MAG: DegT/DnrJ/EryC1/StrS family aminotransferase, partial [Deltaproteobacteria bacterium]|nr:DegT/DnrJ/EryC1/StrS family aminotransferase [Deltaproteobacteria bacterium]
HLFGQSADMDRIIEIGQKANVPIIEDVAQAFGGRRHGRRLGSLGTVGCFSFFPTKNLGAFGDAGLVVTSDPELALQARKLRTHGSIERYRNETLGYNSRLDELQAAILRIKLPRVEAMNAARNVAARLYTDLLSDMPGVGCTPHSESHVYHQFTIRIRDGRRNAVVESLKKAGVSTIVYYPTPVHQLPVYQHLAISCPIAEQAAQEVLSLPIWPQMTPAIQHTVVNAIANALGVKSSTRAQLFGRASHGSEAHPGL